MVRPTTSAAIASVAVALVLLLVPGPVRAQTLPVGDLTITSVETSDTHVHSGDVVALTAVAVNLGPSASPGSMDVTYTATPTLPLRRERCVDGPTPDTPSCEFGLVSVGQLVVVRVWTRVVATRHKYVSAEFCVSQESNYFVDPNPQNDCASVTLKIVGKRPRTA